MSIQRAFPISHEVDRDDLEHKVKAMYREVAQNPLGEFHFEMGREMAERLGYLSSDLNRVPKEAIDSFAGVGYFFQLADLQRGEHVMDLGSGSGMDTFIAALKVGESGSVVGVDMTDEQRNKSEALRLKEGFDNISYIKGYIENVPYEGDSFDVVISNGVINLSPDKPAVFKEVARLLKRGGRMAISDIVTGRELPEGISCDATLWAACIGGAMQKDRYIEAIESAGLRVETVHENPQYQFISDNARSATRKYDVKSISLLAFKP